MIQEWWNGGTSQWGKKRGTASLNDEGVIDNKVVPRCHHCKIFTHQNE
jgi:hypothetical protein